MRFTSAVSFGLVVCAALQADPVPEQAIVYVDLQPKANHKLTDTYPSKRYEDNDLGELPKGKRTLGDVPFQIGDRFIVLGSKRLPTMPEKVEGIAVGAAGKRLHFLHATSYSTVDDDSLIGKYVVNYDDKSKETIEIVFGKDVRDWWSTPGAENVTRGKTVWTGTNKAIAAQGGSLRLYLLTWTNPKPEKRIATIDYVSTQTDSAPFCIAITVDRK